MIDTGCINHIFIESGHCKYIREIILHDFHNALSGRGKPKISLVILHDMLYRIIHRQADDLMKYIIRINGSNAFGPHDKENSATPAQAIDLSNRLAVHFPRILKAIFSTSIEHLSICHSDIHSSRNRFIRINTVHRLLIKGIPAKIGRHLSVFKSKNRTIHGMSIYHISGTEKTLHIGTPQIRMPGGMYLSGWIKPRESGCCGYQNIARRIFHNGTNRVGMKTVFHRILFKYAIVIDHHTAIIGSNP